MFSICTVQFPSYARVTPRCLWLSTSSTDSSLNRMSNSGMLVLFDIIRALVFLGLKSTTHVFAHWSNISKSLFISIWIKSTFLVFPDYMHIFLDNALKIEYYCSLTNNNFVVGTQFLIQLHCTCSKYRANMLPCETKALLNVKTLN